MKTTIEQKKQFALEQISPYYNDPSICGFDETLCKCQNITKDNKMCVVGKNLLSKIRSDFKNDGISVILNMHDNDQSKIFNKEVVDVLTVDEWFLLQSIHDGIAYDDHYKIIEGIKKLNLFSFEELVSFSKKNNK